MPELPVLKTREVLKALSAMGFQMVSQRGSHMKLKRHGEFKTFVVIVPNYNEISKRVLASIIRQSGLSREEFLKYVEK